MTFSFRPAKRSEAKPLIGLYAESGCGKTFGALLIARGFAGPNGRVGMIDTEAGRGEAYADLIQGGYDVMPMRDSFSPAAFNEALKVAESANLDVLIIDSGSHEWSGPGGVLSMAAAEEEKAIAAGRKKSILTWQKPKQEHSRKFMLPLLQTPIPLVIICLRAKYPMIERKNSKGEKEWVRSDNLEPNQADDVLFEMFVHGWIDRYHRLHVTKLTRPDLAQVFRDGELITIETGERLAAWSKGDQPQSAAVQVPRPAADAARSSQPPIEPLEDDGAAPMTADAYVVKWRQMIQQETSAKALHDAWTKDRATRNLITWPDDATFDDLKNEVTRAIDFMKKPARVE